MHPWRGRSRPSQQDLPIRDPEAVLGERHPQMIACEAFLGRPVRKFLTVRSDPNQPLTHPWARAWARHCLEMPELQPVLAEGKSYIDEGLVWHLEVENREVRSIVLGEQLYAQHISIDTLSREDEAHLIEVCRGRVHLSEQLVTGLLPHEVFSKLTAPQSGLLPRREHITWSCSCGEPQPCAHTAAATLALTYRLNKRPGRIFTLRGTEPEVLKGLLPAGLSRPPPASDVLIAEEQLELIFDLRLDRGGFEDEVNEVGGSEDPLASFLKKESAAEDNNASEESEAKSAHPATPPPSRPKAPPPSQTSWLDDDWDDDEEEAEEEETDIDAEVFGGPGPSPVSVTTSNEGEDVLEIGRADLLDLGLPSHRIQRWLADGTLLRTEKRGMYQLTPDAWVEIEPLLPDA